MVMLYKACYLPPMHTLLSQAGDANARDVTIPCPSKRFIVSGFMWGLAFDVAGGLALRQQTAALA